MDYDFGVTTRVPARVTRRSMVGSLVALGAFSRVAPAFASQSTPASNAEGDADALEVLKAAGQAILALETFAFTMDTTQGSSTILPGVELVGVEGAVRRPIDLKATLEVKALMQSMEISAISVDGEFYVQDPLSGGNWTSLGGASQIGTMINPDWILMAAINLIKDATITDKGGDETLVEGYIDFSESLDQLEGMQGSEDLSQIKQFLASGPVDVAFWINKENLITAAELYGPIFASESADVEKRLELSGFNEPVDIEAPAVGN